MGQSRNLERRVVLTGVGVVSPIGIGISAFAASLRGGVCGVAAGPFLPANPAPGHVSGEVREFENYKFGREQRKSVKVMCREIQLGVASANLALEHAGIDPSKLEPERLGVEFGANLMLSPPDELARACYACIDETDHQFYEDRWGNRGLSDMYPLWLLKFLPNMPACHIGIAADARGPNNSLTLDEASGNLVIGEATRIIARGHADVMISGTTGTQLHAIKSMHSVLWDELATALPGDALPVCRPFDARRNGQVIAEAACTVILESESHAIARGATVLADVLGAGSSCVISIDGKPNLQKAIAQASRAALRDADVSPADIGHVNANGIGAKVTDELEAAALKDVFGAALPKIPVTAFKSYWGNPGAGTGILEIAASLVGLQTNEILPTLNFEQPDPACPIDVVHATPRKVSNRLFLNVNVTREGQASAVVLQAR